MERQRNRHLNNKFALLALLNDYSSSFNLYSVAELSRNRVQNKTVNETFVIMCSPSPQNLEFRDFTLLLAEDGEKLYQTL